MKLQITYQVLALVLIIALPIWGLLIMRIRSSIRNKRLQHTRMKLSGLLATIHRDGGHKEEEVGTPEAIELAIEKYYRMIANNEEQDLIIRGIEEGAEQWKALAQNLQKEIETLKAESKERLVVFEEIKESI